MNYLDSIIAAHVERAAKDLRPTKSLIEQCESLPPTKGFINAITKSNDAGQLAVIAEIKRGSPSKGQFDVTSFDDPADWAQQYSDAGASCISVLTDQNNFYAQPEDLQSASNVGVPCLRKDFTVSVNDVIDARIMGASAVLLIAAALDSSDLKEFSKVAADLGLDCLYEIHSIQELDKLSGCEPRLIGINQRDLQTFEVDTERALSICQEIDDSVAKVAESGIRTLTQAEQIADGGFQAVLVGESIVTGANPAETLAGFASVKL